MKEVSKYKEKEMRKTEVKEVEEINIRRKAGNGRISERNERK